MAPVGREPSDRLNGGSRRPREDFKLASKLSGPTTATIAERQVKLAETTGEMRSPDRSHERGRFPSLPLRVLLSSEAGSGEGMSTFSASSVRLGDTP